MSLLDEVFNDLIKDINDWHKVNCDDGLVKEKLSDLKDTLQEHIDIIDTELRYEEQDSSFVGVDERIEEMRIG